MSTTQSRRRTNRSTATTSSANNRRVRDTASLTDVLAGSIIRPSTSESQIVQLATFFNRERTAALTCVPRHVPTTVDVLIADAQLYWGGIIENGLLDDITPRLLFERIRELHGVFKTKFSNTIHLFWVTEWYEPIRVFEEFSNRFVVNSVYPETRYAFFDVQTLQEQYVARDIPSTTIIEDLETQQTEIKEVKREEDVPVVGPILYTEDTILTMKDVLDLNRWSQLVQFLMVTYTIGATVNREGLRMKSTRISNSTLIEEDEGDEFAVTFIGNRIVSGATSLFFQKSELNEPFEWNLFETSVNIALSLIPSSAKSVKTQVMVMTDRNSVLPAMLSFSSSTLHASFDAFVYSPSFQTVLNMTRSLQTFRTWMLNITVPKIKTLSLEDTATHVSALLTLTDTAAMKARMHFFAVPSVMRSYYAWQFPDLWDFWVAYFSIFVSTSFVLRGFSTQLSTTLFPSRMSRGMVLTNDDFFLFYEFAILLFPRFFYSLNDDSLQLFPIQTVDGTISKPLDDIDCDDHEMLNNRGKGSDKHRPFQIQRDLIPLDEDYNRIPIIKDKNDLVTSLQRSGGLLSQFRAFTEEKRKEREKRFFVTVEDYCEPLISVPKPRDPCEEVYESHKLKNAGTSKAPLTLQNIIKDLRRMRISPSPLTPIINEVKESIDRVTNDTISILGLPMIRKVFAHPSLQSTHLPSWSYAWQSWKDSMAGVTWNTEHAVSTTRAFINRMVSAGAPWDEIVTALSWTTAEDKRIRVSPLRKPRFQYRVLDIAPLVGGQAGNVLESETVSNLRNAWVAFTTEALESRPYESIETLSTSQNMLAQMKRLLVPSDLATSDLNANEWDSFLKTFLRDLVFGIVPIFFNVLSERTGSRPTPIQNQDRVVSWFPLKTIEPDDAETKQGKMTSITHVYEVGGMSESQAWDMVGKQGLSSWFSVHEIPYLVRDRIVAWHLYRAVSLPISPTTQIQSLFNFNSDFPSYLTGLRSVFTNSNEFLRRHIQLIKERYLVK